MKTRFLILVMILLLVPNSLVGAQTGGIDIFSENYSSNEETFVNRTWTNRMLYELSEAFDWELSERTLETLGINANMTYYYPLEQDSNENNYEIYLFSGDIGDRQFVEIKITPMIAGTLNKDDRRLELFETAVRLLQPEVSDREIMEGYDDFLSNQAAEVLINNVRLYIEGYSNEVIYLSRELTKEIAEGTYANLAGAVLEEKNDEIVFDEHEVHVATTKHAKNPDEEYESSLPGNFFERAEENALNATYLEAFQYFHWIIYDIYSFLPNYGERMSFEGEVTKIYPRESTQVIVLEGGPLEIADTGTTESYYVYLLTNEIELAEGDIVSGMGQFIGLETTESYTPSIVAEEIEINEQVYEIGNEGDLE